MKRALLRIVLIVGALVLVLPFLLLVSERPEPDPRADEGGLDFEDIMAVEPMSPAPLETWRAPDGQALGLRRYDSGNPGAPLIVAVHGSGWHGLQFDILGKRLAKAGVADVLAPDLRGHGPSSARRGDVDYIGQLEDDLAHLIETEARPGQRVIMLGHSSGGGLVVRFAGGQHAARLDGAILLAPYLGDDPRTTQPRSGGWAKTLVRRFMGLELLNAAGFTGLNGLTVVQLRFPSAVLDSPLGETATRAYSYRMTLSYAPRQDLAADVAGLPPFLLVAGRDDEAFIAEGYEPTMSSANSKGRYQLLEGVGHLDVVDADRTYEAMIEWLTRWPITEV